MIDEPIEKCIEDWHKCIKGELPGGLDAILADDVVFHSPIVFTPQKGIDLTKVYLQAAGGTFSGESTPKKNLSKMSDSGFRYSKEVLTGNHAVLEFETEVAGKYVNGVDIITCNDEGKIVEFKVMIRPLQAVNVMHEMMAAMLEKMKGG
jgi:hypothetical protein